jgi:hypothetical protein
MPSSTNGKQTMNINIHHFFGYIDPGSGSLLLQFMIAAVLGTLGFFRRSIMSLFGSRSKIESEKTKLDKGGSNS